MRTLHFKDITKIFILNFIESYIVTMYGFFAIILAPLFFPSSNLLNSALGAYGAYFATYAIRPIGGMFIGYIGDRHGYKNSLIASFLCLTLPTFCICLLPTYNHIGFFAPFLLILLLMLQSIGAIASNIVNIILNQITTTKKGKLGGLLYFYGFIGSLAAIGTGILFNMFLTVDWSWRLSFLTAAIIGSFGLYLLNKINEVYLNIAPQDFITKHNSLYKNVKKYSLNILISAGISINNFIPFCVSVIYMNLVFDNYFNLSNSQILLNDLLITSAWMLLIPIFGNIADQISAKRLMIISNILIILACCPLFILFEYFSDTFFILEIIPIALTIFGSAYVAPCAALLPKLFPKNVQATCVSVSYSLGVALFGAPAPFIMTLLLKLSHKHLISIIYVIICSLISLICLRYLDVRIKTLKLVSNA